jgi:hypothetical protein
MFKNFPDKAYDMFSDNPIIIKDYYNNISLYFQKYKQNIIIYQKYMIQDGQTPEDISFETYQDTKFWFLILMLNNSKDPFFDWPVSNDDLLNYAIHYVTNDYWEIQLQFPNYLPEDPTNSNETVVNNMIGEVYTQLERENDLKRQIFLPPKPIMLNIYEEYMRLTSNFK